MRFTLAGVGGAFGGREDVSMQVHACLLALHTGRPVKMVYGREESFFGHVHRHPARMRYEHGADARRPAAPTSRRGCCSTAAPTRPPRGAVCSNAASFALGPYEVPSARIDAYVVYTDNPPCGAMRGFGAVQTCFAHEAQMDKLAAALGIDPRRAAAAQRDDRPAPRCRPARRSTAPRRWPSCSSRCATGRCRTTGGGMPGGIANVTHGEGVVRGVGYAVGFKNVGFSEGFDDYSTARVRLVDGRR